MINLFYILFALSFNIKANFIGELYLVQIFIILISIYFFFNNSFKLKLLDYEKRILFLIILWFINQIFSDYINKTIFNDFVRGNIKILITYLSFYSFFKISKIKEISLLKILFWVSFFQIIFLFFINKDGFNLNWKMGGGVSITISLIIFFRLYYKKNDTNNLMIILLTTIGIASLSFETRFLFLFNFMVIFYIIVIEKFRIKKILTIFILTIFFYYLMSNIYQVIISNELLPDALIIKQEIQSNELGFLLGGRNEFISSFAAIKDSPWLGHGSWAKNCDYVYLKYDVMIDLDPSAKLRLGDCLIPTHSIIFGSWVTSGIFGFIFWLHITFKIFKKIINDIILNNQQMVLIFFLGILLIWDFLFSPYGALRMVLIPLYIVIILLTNKDKKNSF